jgi:hypothetical protein
MEGGGVAVGKGDTILINEELDKFGKNISNGLCTHFLLVISTFARG